ncbi:putative exo-1,4-beta-xylosidase bxlB [Leucoagaricus sp. SymC.cos]|nr:putative exo-1,4-beta-xylosidase bxlB [Leucoagaricus sp. SymC.cos]
MYSFIVTTLLVVANVATAQFNYSFPDCTSGPLKSTVVCDTSKNPATRARALIQMFTDEELTQNTDNVSPGVPRLGVPSYQWWSEALVCLLTCTIYLDIHEEQHGVAGSPGVSFAPSGEFSSATSFPQPIVLGATFDMDLVKAIATVISTEARAFNNAGRAGLDFFTPNINPFKDPRWGRGQETPGEDPFHVSQYVLHLIDGLQGGIDPRPYFKIAADCKHFAAYDLDSWEGIDRFHFDAKVSPQDLSEYYLPSFQSCVRDAKVASVMCSYNSVNGVPACASPYLLQNVLRDFWGFDEDRWVTSDCDAINNIFSTHNFTSSFAEAAADALKAGTDVDCGNTYSTSLPDALNQSLIVREDLEKALARQYTSLMRQLTWSDVNTPDAQALAHSAAVEGLVLLKNDGLLPLKPKGEKVAIIGPYVNATTNMQGNYFGTAPFIVTPFQGAVNAGFQVQSSPGTGINDTSEAGFAAAISVAEGADIIIFAGGIDNTIERESRDRLSVAWTGNQLELIKQLASLGKPVIVVQFGGGQTDDTELLSNDAVRAILWAGYPGQSGGTAIFDIITGSASPAGRLSITQYPTNFVDQVGMTDMSLRASDTNPGRTYKWYSGTPVLEFGHGLHFTTFGFSWGKQPAAQYNIQQLVRAGGKGFLDLATFDTFQVRIRNTGNVTSDYVALLFLSGDGGPTPHPIKSLVSFTRAHGIKVGSSAVVNLKVTLGSVARVDERGDLWLFSGSYRLVLDIGDGVLTHDFVLTGTSTRIVQWPQDPSFLSDSWPRLVAWFCEPSHILLIPSFTCDSTVIRFPSAGDCPEIYPDRWADGPCKDTGCGAALILAKPREYKTEGWDCDEQETMLVLLALLSTFLIKIGLAQFNFTFPDCTNGPLRSNVVCDTSKDPATRARTLIQMFTDEELILNTDNVSPGVPRLGIPPYQWWSEALHGVAGSPGVTFASSGNFSSATSFPQPIVLGATFDMDLVKAAAIVTSTEARAFNNAGRAGLDFFTPNINPFKDPRWGRGQETPGEDPFLVSQYVLNLIDGLQGGIDPRPYYKIAADCKHFAAYDLENWEGINRSDFDAKVSLQDLSEYYLPSFQSCVRDAKVASVMCSFNSVNGVPSCASSYLLQDVLRDFWGFNNDRWVVADCDAIENIFSTHNFTSSLAEAAADALKAGTDIDCGTTYSTHLPEALEQSLITRADLEKALTRQYTSLMRVGYFDPPESQPYRQLDWSDVNKPDAQALAYRAAVEGLVLVKNDGVLPLPAQVKRLAVIGPYANATTAMQGNYFGAAPVVITPVQGAIAAGFQVQVAHGTDIDGTSDAGFAQAIDIAKSADTIVFAGGIDHTIEDEAKDRITITWTGNQLELVRQLSALGKPVIVVQFGGGQVDDSELLANDAVRALIWAGYPGQSGGTAIFDIITGKVAPAGRLTTTQYPAEYIKQVNMTDMSLRPSPTSPGRTYKWYTGKPVVEFGHGLHFTTFQFSWQKQPLMHYNIQQLIHGSGAEYLDLATLDTFHILVKNTGKVSSDYVALLFLSGDGGPSPRPLKSLVSFTRAHDIKAGSSAVVSLKVTLGSVARADEQGDLWLFSGSYRLMLDLGDDVLTHDFVLVGTSTRIVQWPRVPSLFDLNDALLSSNVSFPPTLDVSNPPLGMKKAVVALLASFVLGAFGAQQQVAGTLHRRSYFYAGGKYAAQGNSSIMEGAMYVERLTPERVTQPFPLLVVHGHAMTGTNFLNTPDGRQGWGDFFLSQGYEVSIYTQGMPSSESQVNLKGVYRGPTSPTFDTFTVESRFTATQRFKLWPQAILHTQWSGNGSTGDDTFDSFYASTVPSLVSDKETSEKMKEAGSALLDKIGPITKPVILLTHSQSGPLGWVLGDSRPNLIKTIVALEPMGPPFINVIFPPVAPARPFGVTEISVAYEPPLSSPDDLKRVVASNSSLFTCFRQAEPPRKLVNLMKIPILVITSEASYHAVYDGCTVDYLKQAGVGVDHINLGNVGIHGNAHMMFMEKNNIEIAELIQKWIINNVDN